MLKHLMKIMSKTTVVPMLVVVIMILIPLSIFERQYRISTNEAVGNLLNIDPYLFGLAMFLGALFIFVRYIILGIELTTWREVLYYAVAMLPLSYFCLYYGLYLLIVSFTKTTGIFILALWGFLVAEPIIRKKDHDE